MKGTSVQAFTKLAAKIHPVSLSKQESSRLLTALTSSFEKHLDAAHPISRGHDQTKQSAQARGRPNPVHDRPANLTEQLFASVLTNPIIATRAEDSISDKLLKTKRLQKDPMRLFDQYAAAGSATPEAALLCLETFKDALYKGTDKEILFKRQDRQAKILETQAGFNVLRWLWSSRYQASDIFTRDRRLVNIVVEFLLAEGREEMVWRWFERSENRILVQGQYISPKAFILRSLIRAHLLGDSRAGLEAALQSFFRASDGYRAENFPDLPRYRLLRLSGLQLTRALQSADLSAKSRPALLLLYDRFLQSSSSWSKVDNPVVPEIITLKLRHPVFPDTSDALALVRSLRKTPDHDFFSPSLRPKLLNILFETVEVLQAKNNHDDAAWVMEFMREKFADDLEDGQKQYSESKQAAPHLADNFVKATSTEDVLAERALGSVSWRAVPG